MTEPNDELVRYEVSAGVATITLDFPAKRNALSQALLRELAAHLSAAQRDESVRVLVLTHTGRVFCSGMDLSEARGVGAGAGVRAFPDILQSLWDSPKPVVARIAGPARAGGVGLIAACDLAVCVRSATFAFTEVRLGIIPAVISATVIPRLSPRAAAELFLTGTAFDGVRAAEIGLVNAAVEDDELDAATAAYVADLVKGAPIALEATKALLRRTPNPVMAEDLAQLLETSADFFASDEGQEGIRAFGEKRPPRWIPAGPD
ncbi:MAG: enoyl-CoA hydratase/isomerase family protein [Geodermatophilaceae bacterium]|nr:enoyl-CoA hydratase/isomerase family protein [Geodermatophilaceae bacterium]